MMPITGTCNQLAAEGQPCSGWQKQEDELKRLRAEVAAWEVAKKGQPDPDASVRDERDRLRELLVLARNSIGSTELRNRIDAALGGEKS